MTETSTRPLYSRDMLALAMELARYPMIGAADRSAHAVSRTCGSRIDAEFDLADKTVSRIGINARACAVGQASAALLARHVEGAAPLHIADTRAGLEEWLAGAPLPDWPGLSLLEAARDHPGRHEALLLPWKVAQAALFSEQEPR